MKLWEWPLSNIKDTEIKARIIGTKAVMKPFKFMLACKLEEVLLRGTDINIPTRKKCISISS